jgi:hemoglobin-like flavoprotein
VKAMPLNVELLEQSFNSVKDYGEEFSAQFYKTLFEDYPIVKPLFENTHLEVQSKKLFASLGWVVDSLRNPEVLDNTLKGLGTRHVKYGVLPQHYPMVGNSLLRTFAEILATDWSFETEQAWTEAYAIVTQKMLAGANYSQDILNLSNATKDHGLNKIQNVNERVID